MTTEGGQAAKPRSSAPRRSVAAADPALCVKAGPFALAARAET